MKENQFCNLNLQFAFYNLREANKGETMIKNIILGIFLGILLLYIFIYFGGADRIKVFGKKTVQTGEELKQYEKTVKDATIQIEKKLEKAKDKVKEKIP